MFRKLLKSKIHRATVTCSDLDYEGSIAVDAALLEAADIQPFEAVHVWNLANGSRLQTYAVPAGRGSGEICLNGAAATWRRPVTWSSLPALPGSMKKKPLRRSRSWFSWTAGTRSPKKRRMRIAVEPELIFLGTV